MKTLLSLCATSALLFLTACGGSDKASPAPDDSQVGDNPNNPPFLIQANNVAGYSAIALNIPEEMLQLGHYSFSIFLQRSVPFETLQTCSNGGGRTISTNQQLPITAGTVLTDTLEDCFIEELNAIMSGKVRLMVTQYSNINGEEKHSLELDLSEVTFRESPELTVLDPVSITITNKHLYRTIEVKPKNNLLRFSYSDGDIYSLSQFALTNELNLSTAQYRIEYQGRIALNQFSQYLTVATTVPLTGSFAQYPNQGEIELSDSSNNSLVLTANQVINSEHVNTVFNQTATQSYPWNSVTKGSYWWWPGIYNRPFAHAFRNDNFFLIGITGSANFTDFPSMGTVSFLFSRPLRSVNTQQLNNFFGSLVIREYPTISANYAIEGALLHIQPDSPLEPGREYVTNMLEATSMSGMNRLVGIPGKLFASSAIIAEISKEKIWVRPGSATVLSADNSTIGSGLSVKYHWQEITNFGVQFSQNNTAQTTVSIPTEYTDGLIEIRLTIEDEFGRRHSRDVGLHIYEEHADVLFFESEIGDWIGTGQDRFLTNTNGELSTFSDSINRVEVNHAGILGSRAVYWKLELVAPENKELVPGLYENAIRAAFKLPNGNGLSFTGDHRGCNESIGSFEIFEIDMTETTNSQGHQVFDITTLAADFTQYCDTSGSALHGKVRINSNHPL